MLKKRPEEGELTAFEIIIIILILCFIVSDGLLNNSHKIQKTNMKVFTPSITLKDINTSTF